MALNQEEFLDYLRDKIRAPIEQHADDIIGALQGDEKRLRSFQRARADLDKLILKLEAQQFGDLAEQLKNLSDELVSGIAEMNEAITSTNTIVKGVVLFTQVVGLAARIAALA
jgi:hypothetical protein